MPPTEESPLRHYYESWWKVYGEPIWYLAGKDSASDLKVGWYFNDETEDLNGPYESRAEAENKLKQYCDECL